MIKLYLAKEFCHFEAGIQYNEHAFRRNIILTLDQFFSFRQQYQQYGLFTTAYRYDKPNIREANMIGNLYIDFDVSDIQTDFEHVREDVLRTVAALKAIFGIEPDCMEFYFSGNKGVHLIIPAEVLGVQPHPELHMIFKQIAEDMNKLTKHKTIDTRIYDKVRLFRIPNSIHPKTRLYKISITLDELKNLSLPELQRLARQPRPAKRARRIYSTQANRIYQDYVKEWEKEKKRMKARKKRASTTTLDFMPPCIQHLLYEGATEGKRNNSVAVLASYFLQRGVSEEEALERLLVWNDERCIPSLPEREIEKTVQSIYRIAYKYGCQKIQEVSICSSACKFYKDEDRRK